MTSELTKIERSTLIAATRDRVWQALTDPPQFARWFGVSFDGNFQPGARVQMTTTPEAYKGIVFDVLVEEVTPYTFSWRWHPGMPDPALDYAKEPMTRVEFRLEEADGGTLVTVTESGFDQISLTRRAGVFAQNDEGWRMQLVALDGYARNAS
jgi:uncharacterized protein YndB with AHSA1/START domain